MPINVKHDITLAWLAAVVVWLVASVRTKPTEHSQPLSSRLTQLFFFLLAFLLLFRTAARFGLLARRFVPDSDSAAMTGLILTVAGIAFAIWARLYLGQNWSGTVTIKKEHELIRTGPYSIVRHPICAGFSLALLGTAIAIGEIRGLLAFVAAFIGMKLKSAQEENFMKQRFGEEYIQYSCEVKSIVPCIW